MVLTIGVNERVDEGPRNGTLYNSLITFDSNGSLANHHRKLVPTYTERLVWGQDDGNGLKAVKMSIGRLGGLICWEHWMPLLDLRAIDKERMTLDGSGHYHAPIFSI